VRGSLSLKGRGIRTKIVARSAALLFGKRVGVRGSLSLKGRGICTKIVARSAPSPLWGEGWGEGNMRLRWRFPSPYVLYFTASPKGEGHFHVIQ